MSAADLFKDSYDVEFRLKNTFIMIGRMPYYIRNVVPVATNEPKNVNLMTIDTKGEEKCIPLGKLPLRTMVACPSGYQDGFWYTRGPARHRFQGITGSSLWAVMPNGSIEACGVDNCKRLLENIANQPKTRRPGKRSTGCVTRDVYINRGMILIRGRLLATYEDGDYFKPMGDTELSPLSLELLANAGLSEAPKQYALGDISKLVKPKSKKKKIEIENPCAEIIL